jgi:hypothetical protein
LENRHTPRADLDLLLKAFPGHSARIRRRFLSSESFRGLCADYSLASRTLEQFARAGTALQDRAAAEYVRLLAELQAEISALLADPEAQGQGAEPPARRICTPTP